MAFADEVDFDGRLLWWGIEVCTAGDNFATVQYRWATMAGDVNGNHFEERIVSIGNIQRGLGVDHLPVASTLEAVVDNTDFAADFLAARETVATSVFKARFRLLCGVATSAANTYQSTIVTQQVGVFVCMDFPVRNASAVQLSLSDDSLGQLSDLLVAPTLEDWAAARNPADDVFSGLIFDNENDWRTDPTTPIPLQFGASPYVGAPVFVWNRIPSTADYDLVNWPAGSRKNLFPIIVCATRDTVALTSDDAGSLRVVFRAEVLTPNQSAGWRLERSAYGGTTLAVPQTFADSINGGTKRIWKAYKTQTITKNGYAWKLLWIAFHAENYKIWFRVSHTHIAAGGGVNFTWREEAPVGPNAGPWNTYGRDAFMALSHALIGGRPGSGINGKAIDTFRNPVNIAMDLVQYYSAMGAAGVDTTRFLRARNAQAMDVRGAIAAGGGAYEQINNTQLNSDTGPYGIGVLRRNLAALVKSSDMDLFVTQAGQAALVVMAADFTSQTTTFPIVDEARVNNVVDRTPSAGERWSPYNRVFLRCPDGVARGPFDDAAAITSWGRVISKALECKWWDHPIVSGDTLASRSSSDLDTVRNLRFIEAKVRPVISFTTDIGVLVHELGDYFAMAWTRGGANSAYASTLWRLESVTISPQKGSVDVVAVWMDDFVTAQPFLLDNETLLHRSAPTLGQTLTITTGSTTVTRSAGSFITDGVAANDVVRLRHSTEAATAFARNRDVKVVSVTDALNIVVADSVFGAAGAHVLADTDWKILKSYRTYPTTISDPANYPSGSAMYGKISNSVGQFSDGAAANQLLDG